MLQVSGSIPNEIILFFNLPTSFSRTMAIGSTKSLTNEY
jgi:hypothetical protein